MAAREESGNVAPLTMAIMFVLLAFSAIVVDVALALVMQQVQTNDLAAARDKMLAAPTALVLKNSEDPGLFAAQTAVDSLRANGYDGKVTVWFYEAEASEMPASRRALAWSVETEASMPTLFAAFAGACGLPVGSQVTGSAMPYSQGTTWRPADSGNGCYIAIAGATSDDIVFTPVATVDECPTALVSALQARIDEAQAS